MTVHKGSIPVIRTHVLVTLDQVKSKFISIARLKATELHQSAVQQIQYSKNSM